MDFTSRRLWPYLPAMTLKSSVALLAVVLLGGCATQDNRHRLLINIPTQTLTVFDNDTEVASYPVSTSKFGIGSRPGSYATPLGAHRIAKKIGGNAPSGAVFKNRRPTGEVLAPNSPGRDPIVTRILWLRGLEKQNANSFERTIYIHGTPEESRIGTPASYGCIRMRSIDIIELYDRVGRGAKVEIVNNPALAPATIPVAGLLEAGPGS